MADSDRQKCQQKGKAGHNLRAIAQGIPDHGSRDYEHEHKINGLGGEHMRCGNVVGGVGDEKQQRPSAADASSSQNAIAIVSLEPEARTKHSRAYDDPHQYLAGWTQVL